MIGDTSRALTRRQHLGRYVLDHWRFLTGSIAALALSVLTLGLASVANGTPLAASDLAYALALAAGVLALGLIWDGLVRYQDWVLIRQLATPMAAERRALAVPTTGSTADATACFAALHSCEAAWRDEVGRTREQALFYSVLMTRVVHNMKTPLQALRLLLQEGQHAAATGSLTTAWPSIAQHWEAELRRLTEMVTQALQTVRLEELHRDYRPRAIALPALVRDVVNQYRHDWIVRRVTPRLLTHGHAEELTAFTDPRWLQILLEQIVKNGLQYARSAFLIEIRPAPRGVAIVMQDDGPGMNEEDLARACEPFYTGTAGRQTSTATGLGLYLAQQIAHRLGCKLTLDAYPGTGTIVTVVIPRGDYLQPARDTHSTTVTEL